MNLWPASQSYLFMTLIYFCSDDYDSDLKVEFCIYMYCIFIYYVMIKCGFEIYCRHPIQIHYFSYSIGFRAYLKGTLSWDYHLSLCILLYQCLELGSSTSLLVLHIFLKGILPLKVIIWVFSCITIACSLGLALLLYVCYIGLFVLSFYCQLGNWLHRTLN